jgi:hypothetical protein
VLCLIELIPIRRHTTHVLDIDFPSTPAAAAAATRLLSSLDERERMG